jgi:hypothetical protein
MIAEWKLLFILIFKLLINSMFYVEEPQNTRHLYAKSLKQFYHQSNPYYPVRANRNYLYLGYGRREFRLWRYGYSAPNEPRYLMNLFDLKYD